MNNDFRKNFTYSKFPLVFVDEIFKDEKGMILYWKTILRM